LLGFLPYKTSQRYEFYIVELCFLKSVSPYLAFFTLSENNVDG
jgi:hypothetical protein